MTELWRIFKEFKFEAAHKLPHHAGKCSRLHGHSWRGRVYLQGSILHSSGSMQGMLYDFSSISEIFLKPLVDTYLDHHYLNETLNLENPTCEEVARWIFRHLTKQNLTNLIAVEIFETCTSGVLYTPSTSLLNNLSS